MDTDIYIEYDHEHEAKVLLNRPGLTNAARNIIKGDPFEKWINSANKWMTKCRELRYERPWSATKSVFTAPIKKPTYKKVK